MHVVGWLFVVLLLATCSAPGGEAGPLRTLTVRVLGDGVGHVRSVPLGIDCGEGFVQNWNRFFIATHTGQRLTVLTL